MSLNVAGERMIVAGEFSNMFVITQVVLVQHLGYASRLATRARSEQLVRLVKRQLFRIIFNINEPLIFGIPIIYNPALAIPFMLAPIASMTVYYFSMKLNLINAIHCPSSIAQPVVYRCFPWYSRLARNYSC